LVEFSIKHHKPQHLKPYPNIYKPIASYIVTMATTIQISGELLNQLKSMKVFEKESYEEVIWDLVEDRMELSGETKKKIARAEDDIKAGRVMSLEEVKKQWIKNVQN